MDIGVLTFVCVVLLLLALRAARRAWRKRHWEGSGARTAWATTLIVLTVIALWSEVGHHRQVWLASQGMSALTDNSDARADCQRFTEALFNLGTYDGYVYWDNPTVAVYTNESCRALGAYAAGTKRRPSLDQIAAVHLIAHETMHVNGYRNEAEAECRAVQLNHLVAEKLGATESQARELQTRYFVEVYPNLRSDYTSGQCREGGKLDIFPERTTFP